MDENQSKLVQIKDILPNYLKDRQKLKSLFCDTLPNNKLHVNLLINAFDENIVESLSVFSDKTLLALKCVRTLIDNYGVSNDNAIWAIQTWCYLFGLNDIAEMLGLTKGKSDSANSIPSMSGTEYKIRAGVYKAGVDFPAGELCIKNITNPDNTVFGIAWGIGKNPAKIRADVDSHFFHDRVYLYVAIDEYLKIEGPKNTEVIVQKVETK